MSTVGWLPRDEFLITGMGGYSLSGNNAQAALQFWRLDAEGPVRVAEIALPGCCVDATAWNEEEHEILAYSGLSTQSRGFLTALDARTWLPTAVFEIVFGQKIIPTEEGAFYLSSLNEFNCIDRSSGSIRWSAKVKGDATDAAWDPNTRASLLSDGRLLRGHSGQNELQLNVLEGCCHLATLPNGDFVGVSNSGMIGVWERTSG